MLFVSGYVSNYCIRVKLREGLSRKAESLNDVEDLKAKVPQVLRQPVLLLSKPTSFLILHISGHEVRFCCI